MRPGSNQLNRGSDAALPRRPQFSGRRSVKRLPAPRVRVVRTPWCPQKCCGGAKKKKKREGRLSRSLCRRHAEELLAGVVVSEIAALCACWVHHQARVWVWAHVSPDARIPEAP